MKAAGVQVAIGPDLVRIFEELAGEEFLSATEDVQTLALALLDDERLMNNEETSLAKAALSTSIRDLCRIVNQSAALGSENQSYTLMPIIKETFSIGSIKQYQVITAAKISLAAAMAASIGDSAYAEKMFGSVAIHLLDISSRIETV